MQVHAKDINRLTLNKDRTLLLTCSKDHTAKLLDADTLQVSRRGFHVVFSVVVAVVVSVVVVVVIKCPGGISPVWHLE